METTVPAGCRSLTVHGVAKGPAVVLAALCSGGLLIAIATAVIGLFQSRRELLWLAVALFSGETLIMFTLFPVTLAVSFLLAYIAYTTRQVTSHPPGIH